MPKKEKVARSTEAVRAEVAPSRSKLSFFRFAKDRVNRIVVSAALAATLSACAAPLDAQEKGTTPVDKKPVAAAVEKKPVQYTEFDDTALLQPYIEAAKNMIVKIDKLAEYVVTTNFVLLPMRSGHGVELQIWVRDDSQPDKLGEPAGRVPFDVSLDKIAVLDIDTKGTVPFAKGNILALADYNGATYYYLDATGKSSHNWAGRLDDVMKPCKIIPGVEVAEGGVSVFPVPANLGEYPFLVRADLNPPDGTVGNVPLQFTGPKSTLVARNE